PSPQNMLLAGPTEHHPGAPFVVRSHPRTNAFHRLPQKLLKRLFGTLVRKLLPLCRLTVLAFTGNKTYAPQAPIMVLGTR
ncbi:hypothetical protein, partial [Pseudomonas mediterranea]|uniref:hypothetical protein n=1 Tax=Pseudomonas mediterranea TaxID=183795 RepID=UPI0019D38A55